MHYIKPTLLFLLFLLNCQIQAQGNGFSKSIIDGNIVIGVRDSLSSQVLDMQRDFYVYVPTSSTDTSKRYPTVYMLDAEEFFISTVGLINNLSLAWGGTKLPEMIVVGIPHTEIPGRRMTDMTPTVEVVSSFPDSLPFPTGRGSAFLDYMEMELIPHINKYYPTSTNSTYAGHSLGGLAVIYALLDRPYLFDNYIALDPSLWWDQQVLSRRAESALDTLDLSSKALFVGMANTLPAQMTIEQLVANESHDLDIRHPRSIWRFINEVVPESNSELKFESAYYPDDGHTGMMFSGLLDAFRALYSWYDNDKVMREVMSIDMNPDTAVKKIVDHYNVRSEKLGYRDIPQQGTINYMAKTIAEDNKSDLAEALYEMNIDYYPGDAGGFIRIGDFYKYVGDKTKALQAYSTAMDMGADEETVQDRIDRIDKD